MGSFNYKHSILPKSEVAGGPGNLGGFAKIAGKEDVFFGNDNGL